MYDVMKAWLAAILCLVGVAAGCRTNPAILALERENRQLEDQMYQLEYDLEKAQAALDSCRRENSTLKQRMEEGGPSGAKRPSGSSPKLFAPESSRSPAAEKPQESPADLRPPVIEVPSLSLPPGEIPEALKRPPRTKSPQGLDGLEAPEPPAAAKPKSSNPDEPPPAFRSPKTSRSSPRRGDSQVRLAAAVLARSENAAVQQITLNRFLTGGCNMDRQLGDEGVTVVLEPRDAGGQFLAAPAHVSIVVMDRLLQGQASRVARWDFNAAEVAASYRKTAVMEGFYLEMPWPAAAPQHNHLDLFVRYTTDDGRRLEVQQPITVALYGQPTQRWSPAVAGAGSDRQDSPGEANSVPAGSTPARVREASRPQRPVWSPNRQ